MGHGFADTSLIEKGHITSGSILGHPEIRFPTRKEAQSAALKAAQDVIDVRGPFGGSIR